jgi:LuxR family maltose regulon positive regulatory protein
VLNARGDKPAEEVVAARLAAAKAGADARWGDRIAIPPVDDRHACRQLVRDYYTEIERLLTLLARPAVQPAASPAQNDALTALAPRTRQVLERLLAGDSEKQVARALGLSPHTVHDHVKAIYRTLDVASRGELMARFIRRP